MTEEHVVLVDGKQRTLYKEVIKERILGVIIVSELVLATSEDIETAKNKHIKGVCDHSIIYDEPGAMYDERTCYTCGIHLGLL